MPEKRKVVIDCDTGVDDALALLLAFQHLDVVGITTVGGNVGLSNVQRNTRYVAELAGRWDIPVFAGYDRPLLVPLQDASHVHGKGGLGPVVIPEPKKPLEPVHAVDFLIDTFLHRDDVSLVTTAPLTNIAHALLREPRLKERIPEILCMCGSTTYGNATPAAEFNIYVDPEAAKLVFESGIPMKMVGLNLCRQYVTTAQATERLRALDTPVSRLAAALFDSRVDKSGMNHLCDVCCLMWYCAPEVITKSAPMHVAIETKGEFTRGMTLCDTRAFDTNIPATDIGHQRSYSSFKGLPPNVEVALELDAQRFDQVFYETIRQYR